jgi:hypothetical protein
VSPFGVIPSSFFNKPWHRFTNGAGEEIPAYACMRITTATETDNDIVFTCAKPNSTDQPFYLVNGPLAVASGGEGRCSTIMQAGYVLTSGSPSVYDEWGPTNGSWEVSENGSGFLMLGPAQSDPTRAPAVQKSAGGSGLIATAQAAEKMCGASTGAVSIKNFVLQGGTMPGAVPTQAANYFQRQSPEDALLELHYYLFDPYTGASNPLWVIAIPQMRRADRVQRVYWHTGDKCLKEEYHENAALESCEELQERDILCFEECPAEE